jgi:general secretion pathway protein G
MTKKSLGSRYLIWGAVIILLLSIVGVRFYSIEDSKTQEVAYRISMFQMAIERFRVRVGRYPTNAEGLGILVQESDKCEYICDRRALVDPWGMPLRYVLNGNKYKIYSTGPNRIDEMGRVTMSAFRTEFTGVIADGWACARIRLDAWRKLRDA